MHLARSINFSLIVLYTAWVYAEPRTRQQVQKWNVRKGSEFAYSTRFKLQAWKHESDARLFAVQNSVCFKRAKYENTVYFY